MLPIDESKLDQLHERFRPFARRCLEIADALAQKQGKRVRITQALRSKEVQDGLYAKGRTAPGSIVTYVQGGYSWHNYGLAFDIGVFADGFETYLGGDPLYREIGKEIVVTTELAEVIWGGTFPQVFGGTFVDLPHYEWHPGYSVKEGAGQVLKYLGRPQDIGLQVTAHLPAVVPPSPPANSVGFTGAIVVGSQDWQEMKALMSDIHKARVTIEEANNTVTALRGAQYEIFRRYDPTF